MNGPIVVADRVEDRLRRLEVNTFPVPIADRGRFALPPFVSPSPHPRSALRRRVRQIAREHGLVEVPRMFWVTFDSSGLATASLDFGLAEDEGPVIICGIDGAGGSEVASGTGTYTAQVTVGGRPINEGPLKPDVAWPDDAGDRSADASDLLAPIIMRRGERFVVEVECAAGDTVKPLATWRLRCLQFRDESRNRPGVVADVAADKLLSEGEMFAFTQVINSTTPEGARPWKAPWPILWHSLSIRGLDTLTSFARANARIGGEALFGRGIPPFPAGASADVEFAGDVAISAGEHLEFAFDAVTPGAGEVTASWVGRVFRR